MKKIKVLNRKKTISKKLKLFLRDKYYKDEVLQVLNKYSKNKNFFDFSVSDPTKLSYMTPDRIPDNFQSIWNDDYRKNKAYHIKPGKLLSGFCDNELIKRVSSDIFQRADNNRIIITSEICKYYLEENYSKQYDGGALYGSCMRHPDCQEYISLYESFGTDVVQLVCLLDASGDVLARALLWYNVKHKSGEITEKYMDRIYAVNDNFHDILYSYAIKHKILTWGERGCQGLKITNIDIPLDHPTPYFDTFKNWNMDDNILNDYGDGFELRSTDGERIEDQLSNKVYIDGEYFEEEDCVYFDDFDQWVLKRYCIRWNGEYYHPETDQLVYSNVYGDYVYMDDAVFIDDDVYESGDDQIIYCDLTGEWLLKENTVEDYNGNAIPADNAILFKEEYYHESDKNIIKIDGKLFHKDSDAVIFENGEYKIAQLELM